MNILQNSDSLVFAFLTVFYDFDFAKTARPFARNQQNQSETCRNIYNKTWSIDDAYAFLNENQIIIKYKV